MIKSAMDMIAAIRPSIVEHTDDVVPQQDRDALLESIMANAVDRPKRVPVYRRPLVTGAVAAGVAAAAVVATAVIPSSGGDVSTGQIQNATYVVDQMTKVLSNANLVVHYRDTMAVNGSSYVEDHWYRLASDISRTTIVGADGTPCVDATETGIEPIPPAVPHPNPTVTGVDYTDHTWWSYNGPTLVLPAPACLSLRGSPFYTLGFGTGLDQPGAAGNQLITLRQARGQARIVGTGEIVDGQPTIELALGPQPSTQESITIWVNQSTYQPLRIVLNRKDGSRTQTECEFLPPTTANLAKLELTVPPDFRQVAPPSSNITSSNSPPSPRLAATNPSTGRSVSPTSGPSVSPTSDPSVSPTPGPSVSPTSDPSAGPTSDPSVSPTPDPALPERPTP
jgi:hypothetical protein